MNIFYEDGGQFKVATVVQKNDSTYQADTQHGKRVKVKANHVFVEFEGSMDDFFWSAQAEAEQVDIALLWEAVGTEEFSADVAAGEYFGTGYSRVQLAAILMAIYAAPMYFHKKSKGVFKAAPEEVLKQALAAIERKAQQEAQIQAWAEVLVSGSLPEAVAVELPQILHAPDKQSLAYKAFHVAMERLDMNALALARHVGGITSMPQYLLQRFEYKYFPKGTGFPDVAAPMLPEGLPVANVRAFSIDDESTTEVDDALSVQDLGEGRKRVGIHIAAPALGIEPHGVMEEVVLQRLSTVYFPANKITMLPEHWISAFSLDEGKTVPAFSIYVDVDDEGRVLASESRIECVPIAHNLRIQHIEPFFNSETGVGSADKPQFPHHEECLYLLKFAYQLQAQRDRLDDPNQPKKYDYGIDFDEQGKVIITRRERGSPIDTLVSEMMILANTSWAQMLDEHELAGLFRVQPSAGRVRMSTHSERHIGMNVEHYGWFTSPLRRACDYINQKQLQSLLSGSAPRFEKNDSDLFLALNNFETAYSAYRSFQEMMEQYWAMVWLQQEGISVIRAVILKEDLVRLEGVPLVGRVTGIPLEIAPKTMINVAITDVDTEAQFLGLKYLSVVPNAVGAEEEGE